MPTFTTANALVRNCGHSTVPMGVLIAATGVQTAPAGTAIGDVIEMVPVPKGATVVDVKLHASAGTSLLTISVGDAGVPARYISALDAAAAVVASANNAAGNPVGYAYPANDTVDMVLAGAGATATHVYTMVVTYVMS